MENAGSAITAVWLLGATGFTVPEAAIHSGLGAVEWPGRFEIVERNGRSPIILDGAHTPAAAAAVAETVAQMFPGIKAVVVLALLADKNPFAILASLAPISRAVIATRVHGPRALEAEPLQHAAETLGLPADAAPNVADAVQTAEAMASGTNGIVLVTGSLSTVAEAREALGLAAPDPSVADR
jgi:dihydrofolate synthase/folylpolyglutamate synthase